MLLPLRRLLRSLMLLTLVTGATLALAQPTQAEEDTEPIAAVVEVAVAVVEVAVAVRDDRFADARITIAAGTIVTWTHKGNNLHTVSATEGLWDSGTLQRDETYSFTFTEPGVYTYLCRQHLLQGMRGTITVE